MVIQDARVTLYCQKRNQYVAVHVILALEDGGARGSLTRSHREAGRIDKEEQDGQFAANWIHEQQTGQQLLLPTSYRLAVATRRGSRKLSNTEASMTRHLTTTSFGAK